MSLRKNIIQIRSILWKDLVLTLRRSSEISAALIFAFLASIVLGYGVNRYGFEQGALILGVGLVFIELFISIFTALMAFVGESDKGTLDGLRASPISPRLLFVSKLLYTFIILELLAVAAGITASVFGEAWDASVFLLVVVTTGFYLASASAFASAISIYVEARGALLPTIILALCAPMLQSVIKTLGEPGIQSSTLMLVFSGVGFMMVTSWLSSFILEV